MRRLLVLVTVAVLLGLPASAAPQDRAVNLGGRVQWIAGQTLILDVDDGPSVRIDLTRVPQGDYQSLSQGEPIFVTGVLSSDYRRVMGTSIQRGYRGGGFQSP